MTLARAKLAARAGVLLASAILAGGCPGAEAPSARQRPARTTDAIHVRVGPVTSQSIAAFYVTSATLRAAQQATVIARTQGVIERFSVEEGDAVERDQELAALDDAEQRIERARATTLLADRKSALSRSERLHARGALSDIDMDTARRELEDARHRLALADLALSRTTIRAPFAGRVLRRHLDPGATVQNGSAVLDLADVVPLYADVDVPERHVSRLAPGRAVRLTSDAGGAVVTGRIERIAPVVEAGSGTVRVTVAVAPAADPAAADAAVAGAALRPGSFVRVEVEIETRPSALVVPRAALVAEGRRWHVFRLRAEAGVVERVPVAPGLEEGDLVEVRAPAAPGAGEPAALGLGAGDLVVVVGAPALADGARVEVPAAPSSADAGPAGAEARADASRPAEADGADPGQGGSARAPRGRP